MEPKSWGKIVVKKMTNLHSLVLFFDFFSIDLAANLIWVLQNLTILTYLHNNKRTIFGRDPEAKKK